MTMPMCHGLLAYSKGAFQTLPIFPYCSSFETWKVSIWILEVFRMKHNGTIAIRVTMIEKYLTVNILQGNRQ